jgi:hypothetical protein
MVSSPLPIPLYLKAYRPQQEGRDMGRGGYGKGRGKYRPAMAEETIAPVVTLRKNVIDLRLPKILLCLHCPIS